MRLSTLIYLTYERVEHYTHNCQKQNFILLIPKSLAFENREKINSIENNNFTIIITALLGLIALLKTYICK